jgi:hypothetical protein
MEDCRDNIKYSNIGVVKILSKNVERKYCTLKFGNFPKVMKVIKLLMKGIHQ